MRPLHRGHTKTRVPRPGNLEPADVDATSSFRDSWATDLTAVGAILGTVLESIGPPVRRLAGSLHGHVLGVQRTLRAAGRSGARGLRSVLLAHDVSGAPGKPEPTYFGLLAAGTVVLWAVMGELLTTLKLVAVGGMPTWGLAFCILGFLVILVALFFYSRASIQLPIAPKDAPSVDGGAAATSAAATAAALAGFHVWHRRDAKKAATAAAKAAIGVATEIEKDEEVPKLKVKLEVGRNPIAGLL